MYNYYLKSGRGSLLGCLHGKHLHLVSKYSQYAYWPKEIRPIIFGGRCSASSLKSKWPPKSYVAL